MKPIEVSAAVTYYNLKKDSLIKKSSQNFLLNDSALDSENEEEEEESQLFSRDSFSRPNKIMKIPPSQRLLKRRDAVVIAKTGGDFEKIYKWRYCRGGGGGGVTTRTTRNNNNKSSTVCDRCQLKVSNFPNGHVDGIAPSSPLFAHTSPPPPPHSCADCKSHFPVNNNILHYFRNEYNRHNNKKRQGSEEEKDCYGKNCSIA